MSLRLHSDGWEAEVRPALGGSIGALRFRGLDILRPMPGDASNPLDGSCFPLAPYCNRISNGRFHWQGRDVQLPLNFLPQRHPLHGLSWHRPWQITSLSDFKCTLEDRYDGSGAWPWAYDAEQRIRLGPKGCAISLNVTNRSSEVMPCGLGLHPYFRRNPETKVRFSAGGMMLVDEGLIPSGEIAADDLLAEWETGTALPSELVDHCFTDWAGAVHIGDDLGTITMTARGAPLLHVYSPEDGSALCFEPVSHAPDALNLQPEGMTALPPGCTASLQIWISATA